MPTPTPFPGMTGEELSGGLSLITGLITPLFNLVTTFPVNILAAFMVAGLAFGIVKKLIHVFGRRH